MSKKTSPSSNNDNTSKQLELLKTYEDIITMYDNVFEYSRKNAMISEKALEMLDRVQDKYHGELKSLTRDFTAMEHIGDLSRTEQIEDDRIKSSLEETVELSRREQIEKDKIIEAHEAVEEMSRSEIAEKEKFLHALENLDELSRNELIERDKLINAQSNVQELARRELIKSEERNDKYRTILLGIRKQIVGFLKREKSRSLETVADKIERFLKSSENIKYFGESELKKMFSFIRTAFKENTTSGKTNTKKKVDTKKAKKSTTKKKSTKKK